MRALAGNDLVAYLRALKPGERVIETGECCLKGRQGTVYISEHGGGVCVLWDKEPGEQGKMGTGVTGGTRRISDCDNAEPDKGRAK